MDTDDVPDPATANALEFIARGQWEQAAAALTEGFILKPDEFSSLVRENLRVPLYLRGYRLTRIVGQGFVVRRG